MLYILNVYQAAPGYSLASPPDTIHDFGLGDLKSSASYQQLNTSYESAAPGPSSRRGQPKSFFQSSSGSGSEPRPTNICYEGSFYGPSLRHQQPGPSFASATTFPSTSPRQMGTLNPGIGIQQTSDTAERQYSSELSGHSFEELTLSKPFSWDQTESCE
jgi:hypothetical protein